MLCQVALSNGMVINTSLTQSASHAIYVKAERQSNMPLLHQQKPSVF